jgi:hypothetical protein
MVMDIPTVTGTTTSTTTTGTIHSIHPTIIPTVLSTHHFTMVIRVIMGIRAGTAADIIPVITTAGRSQI